MNETPREWSSSEVLKVGGVIVRQGVFTGHSPDLGTPGKPGFRENAFTPSVLEMIKKNFKKSVPIYIDHPTDPKSKRTEIGKTFKVGVSQARDSVVHEGIVWDESGRQRIEKEGYNRSSPEIDLTWDVQGNIVDARLTAVTYVRNPSIGGTDATMMAMCFDKGPNSSGGDSMTKEDQNSQPPSGGGQAPPENPPEQKSVPPAQQPPAVPPPVSKPPADNPPSPPVTPQPQIQYVTDPALVAKLNEMSAKLATYDSVMPGLIQQNETMKTQQLGAISNELKEFGIEAPETLVEGLPIDGKIKALAQLRERLIKAAPLAKAPESVSAIAARAEQDKNMFTQALASLGLTEADYNRVMNGGKINV